MKPNHSWTIVPVLILLIGLTSCNKETLEQESTFNEARLEELAGRYNQDMPEDEFAELYQMVKQKTDEAYAELPSIQADLSNREYLINYSNQVRIEVGGAVYLEDRDEVVGGTTANGVFLPPELFQQLDESAPHQIRLRIRDPFNWTHYVFGLREVTMTVIDQGSQNYYGLYNVNSKEYLFLNVAGGSAPAGNPNCGVAGLGRVYGKVASPYSDLTNGEVSYGIIAGCPPIVVAGAITFFYTGEELP